MKHSNQYEKKFSFFYYSKLQWKQNKLLQLKQLKQIAKRTNDKTQDDSIPKATEKYVFLLSSSSWCRFDRESFWEFHHFNPKQLTNYYASKYWS